MIDETCNFSDTNDKIFQTVHISVINSSEEVTTNEGTRIPSIKTLNVTSEEKDLHDLNIDSLETIETDVSYTIDLHDKTIEELSRYLNTLHQVIVKSCNKYNLNIYILTYSTETSLKPYNDVPILVEDVPTSVENVPTPVEDKKYLFKNKFNDMLGSLPNRIFNNIIIINFSCLEYTKVIDLITVLKSSLFENAVTELKKNYIHNIILNRQQKKFLKVINCGNVDKKIRIEMPSLATENLSSPTPSSEKPLSIKPRWDFSVEKIDISNIVDKFKQFVEERRCSYGKLIQRSGTCWISAVLNGFMLSRITRTLMILKTQDLIKNETRILPANAFNKYKCTIDQIMQYGRLEEGSPNYLSEKHIISSIIYNIFIQKYHIYVSCDFLEILGDKIKNLEIYKNPVLNHNMLEWRRGGRFGSTALVSFDAPHIYHGGGGDSKLFANIILSTYLSLNVLPEHTSTVSIKSNLRSYLRRPPNNPRDDKAYYTDYIRSKNEYKKFMDYMSKNKRYVYIFPCIYGLNHVITSFECNNNLYIYDSNKRSAVKITDLTDHSDFFDWHSTPAQRKEYEDIKKGKIIILAVIINLEIIARIPPYTDIESIISPPIPGSKPSSDIPPPLSCSQSLYNFISRLMYRYREPKIGIKGGYPLLFPNVYFKKNTNNNRKYSKVKHRSINRFNGGAAKAKYDVFRTKSKNNNLKKTKRNVLFLSKRKKDKVFRNFQERSLGNTNFPECNIKKITISEDKKRIYSFNPLKSSVSSCKVRNREPSKTKYRKIPFYRSLRKQAGISYDGRRTKKNKN